MKIAVLGAGNVGGALGAALARRSHSIDFGRLDDARLLEPLALVWIRLAYQHGLGRDFAFGLLRR